MTPWADHTPDAFHAANGQSFEVEGIAIRLVDLSHAARRARHLGEEYRRGGKPSLGAAYDRVADALLEAYRMEAQS